MFQVDKNRVGRVNPGLTKFEGHLKSKDDRLPHPVPQQLQPKRSFVVPPFLKLGKGVEQLRQKMRSHLVMDRPAVEVSELFESKELAAVLGFEPRRFQPEPTPQLEQVEFTVLDRGTLEHRQFKLLGAQ